MKPKFETMSRAELQRYVLAHRDDQEAFHALMDRVHVDNPNPVWHSREESTQLADFLSEARNSQN